MLVAPILESPGARQSAEESTTAADGLGGGERMASMVDRSVMVPGVSAEAAGSSGAEVGVTDTAPESGAGKSTVPEEQTVLPEASKGMVGHAV